MHDREIPSTSKGKEEGTARGRNKNSALKNMAAPMVFDHFDKSLQEFR